VDGIERDLDERAQVIRLSVLGELGGVAARRYGVKSVPTLILFDGTGKSVGLYTGIPNRKEVVKQIDLLSH